MELASQLRNEVVARVVPALPRKLRERLVPPIYSWSYADLKAFAAAPDHSTKVRLLIAPANYASQAYYWARAAETLKDVSAQNLVFGYSSSRVVAESDVVAHENAGKYSKIWAQKQRKAILRDFTHVLYEAERPILGGLYGGDVVAEVRDLQKHGIKVALLSHGSDVRTPSRHIELEEFSPFIAPLDGLTEACEFNAHRNHKIIQALETPRYVSTPDLVNYVPDATWLPTLTSASRWQMLPPSQLGRRTPLVLHIPSKSALKGTSSIRTAMNQLESEGLIVFMEAEGVPYEDMPELVARADIIIDQVGMGSYGVTSIESMYAGRPVVAQAGNHTRSYIKRTTGWDLPIIEANPKTIYSVLKDIAEKPAAYTDRITSGKDFVSDVHSAERVAQYLRPFLFQQDLSSKHS